MRSKRKTAFRAAPGNPSGSPLRAIAGEPPPDAAHDEPTLASDAEIGARELAELTARGSHLRRVRRRAPRPRGATPRASAPRFTRTMIAARVAIAVVVLVAFVGVLGQAAVAIALAGHGASAATLAVTVFGLLASAYLALTVWHALRYRPVERAGERADALPCIAVIVPAYDEGAAVRVALESALASDYPEDRMHVIAVDDGSRDDTWAHISAVAAAHPGRVTAIRQPRNGGKREALRTAFERTDADVAVTVDSDSKLHPGALRAIVAPLLADPDVAAVAGRVLVLNREDNLLTRLLSARFHLTFDLARAAQSRFGAVLCTPGALSAYRMSAVREVLGRWSSQTFLGRPCSIAEDRALTTWLLRAGHRSVYQRTAVVETLMPTTLPRMARMLVRWERGNIREDLVMLPLLATRWRARDRWWPTMEIVLELLQYPLAWLGMALVASRLLTLAPAAQGAAIATVLGAVVLGAVVQTLYCLRSERGSDFAYGVGYALFAFACLQWVFPYSLLTVRDGRWLTR